MANTSNLLMFAYVPPEYVVETIDYWADTLKLDGLIIGNICEWYSTEDDYFSRTEELIKFNNTCRDNGLAFNFLKIAIGYQEFPVWNDKLAIKQKHKI